jgi:hypothetical protein
MDLDVTRLGKMHPLLAVEMAAQYGYQAAIGLARHSHVPGANLAISLSGGSHQGRLFWSSTRPEEVEQLDFHRVTEEAAEAISLALVNVANGWVIRRRLQRGEFADWLLADKDNNSIALEISGVDDVDTGERRLQTKLVQVRQCEAAPQKAACVVELSPPRTRLAIA